MSVREALSGSPPHVSLKTAWKRLIQVSRRLKRAGHNPSIRGRSDVDRLLGQDAPEDWDPSTLKQLLKSLVGSEDEAEQDALALAIDQQLSPMLQATQVADVEVHVHGGPDWLSTSQIDAWLGTKHGSLQCGASDAAAWRHHLHGLNIGGRELIVDTDSELPLPSVRRSDRARRRVRESTVWLPHWDDVGRISLTPRVLADSHASKLLVHAEIIFDPFCGLGGDAIAAAQAGATVFAAEVDADRRAKALQNALALGVGDRIAFTAGSGPDHLKDWAHEAPTHALYLDPPWGGRDWNRKEMNWEALCGGYPQLTSAMERAQATLIKLPRTFDTKTLDAIGGSWVFALGLGAHSDHPADRVRFLTGLHQP